MIRFLKTLGVLFMVFGLIGLIEVAVTMFISLSMASIFYSNLMLAFSVLMILSNLLLIISGFKLFKLKNSFLSFYKKYCFFALSISTASVLYKISSMINMMNHPKTKDFYVDFTFMDKFKTLMEGSDGYYLIVGFILVIVSLIFFKKQNKYFKNEI
tara:strand:+ start:19844 stop:20311 length:468 start_codon:yes stop_codon:yes gene_type:complete